MPSVYIETTIPSFYYTARRSVQSLAWREETRRWWSERRRSFDVYTSVAVIRELEASTLPLAQHRLELLADIPRVSFPPLVDEVAAYYMRHKLMPTEAFGDAVHVALASVHHIDFVFTWNCRHLANANKVGHLLALNRRLHLHVPALVTPYNLT